MCVKCFQFTDMMSSPLSEVRKRNVASVDGKGKIKLTLRYDQDKRVLKVIVHQASGLPGSDLPDPPDPYVKLYLLPEKNKKSKRKTEVSQGNSKTELQNFAGNSLVLVDIRFLLG